jgi:hypothetical protein
MSPSEQRRRLQHDALKELANAERRAAAICGEAGEWLTDDELSDQARRFQSEHEARFHELERFVDATVNGEPRSRVAENETANRSDALRDMFDAAAGVADCCKQAWRVAHGPHRIAAVSQSFSEARRHAVWLERAMKQGRGGSESDE